jgi:PAS domain S-box-containing protein
VSTPDGKSTDLRQRAEMIAGEQPKTLANSGDVPTPDAVQETLHELKVYQIELEMQNEELRRAQLQLDNERARYFDLYDLAPVGYLAVNEVGLVLQSNLKAASLLGLARSELVNRPISRFIAKDSQDDYYQLRRQSLETGQTKQCDLQMATSLGAKVWVQLTAVAEQEEGDRQRLRIVINDISERKLAEESLYDSEERYRTLFNSMDEGFAIIEVTFNGAGIPVDFKYLDANPGFEMQSGLHDVLGKNIVEILPDIESFWLENYGRVALTGEAMRFTGEVKNLGRWFNVFAFRIGPPLAHRVAVVFNDVTALRRAEADRLFLDQTLERKNAELERATQVAEKANHAKSDFLSKMSHELRTPLTAILGFAQLMDAGSPAPSPSQKRSLEQILKAGWYLLELINEVLDLAVIESGKVSLSIHGVAVASLLLECEALVEPQAKLRGVSVRFEKSPTPYFVMADRIRLKQAIINLLSNAIKYNKAGGTVSLNFNGDDPKRLRICVEDTGEGLRPEQISQLFQPFNRLGQEAYAEQPGTGIGLVMAKHLVELMGGELGVSSQVGKGSIFWIDLDQLSEQEFHGELESRAKAAAVLDAGARVNIGGEGVSVASHLYTLLLVGGDDSTLMLMQGILASRPEMRLHSTPNGASVFEKTRAVRPDLILIDSQLPDISLNDAMRILRNDPELAHVPVLALSANAMPQDIENALTDGYFMYVTKPIRINEFMDTLDLALAHGQKSRPSASLDSRASP